MTTSEIADKLASDAAREIDELIQERHAEKIVEACCLKELLEAVAMLKKYQARYHGALHAQQDWEKSNAILTALHAKLKERGVEL